MGLYVDESYSHPRVNSSGHYVLSAVRVKPDCEVFVRAEMLKLKVSSESKVHWRKSSPQRKHLFLDSLVDMPITHITVARRATSTEATERQRRKTLERLIFETNDLGSDRLVLESRGIGDDRKDIAFMSKLRRSSGRLESTQIEHVPGRIKPLLWIPDIVCGAVFAHLNGQSGFWQVIQTMPGSQLIKI